MFRKRIHKEIYRKLFHLLQIPILVGYTVISIMLSKRIGLLTLTAVLLILLELEYLRIEYKPAITRWLTKFINRWLLRKKEKNNVVSAVFFVSGSIIAFSVFDYPIALAALLFTALGDLVAALCGIRFGKTKIFRNKTYVGTFMGLITNIIVGYLLMGSYPQLFIPMAMTASLVETLTQKLDDNLTVPLFSGFIGQLLVFLLRIDLPMMFGLV